MPHFRQLPAFPAHPARGSPPVPSLSTAGRERRAVGDAPGSQGLPSLSPGAPQPVPGGHGPFAVIYCLSPGGREGDVEQRRSPPPPRREQHTGGQGAGPSCSGGAEGSGATSAPPVCLPGTGPTPPNLMRSQLFSWCPRTDQAAALPPSESSKTRTWGRRFGASPLSPNLGTC